MQIPDIKLAELLPSLAGPLKDSLLDLYGSKVDELEVMRRAVSSRPKLTGTRQILIDLSTRDIDRDNEIVLPQGLDLSHFQLAPNILDSHNYSSIKYLVGHALKISADERAVTAVVEFLPMPNELAELAWTIAQHMRLTASIGFIPTDVIDKSHADWADLVRQMAREFPEFKKHRDKLRRVVRQGVLLEGSVCSVPMNIHALQQEVSKQLHTGEMKPEEAVLVQKAFGALSLSSQAADNEEDEPLEGFKDWSDFESKTVLCGPDGESLIDLKPFPNEHAARLVSPDKFDQFRRQNNQGGSGVHFIFGIKKGPPRKSELQAIRFDAKKFTVAQARKWLKDHDHKPILLEPATGGKVLTESVRVISEPVVIASGRDEAKKVENVIAKMRGRV